MARVVLWMALLAAPGPSTPAVMAQWYVGLGRATIHDPDRSGIVGLTGYERGLDEEGIFRLGGVATLGTPDEGFVSVQASVAAHLAPEARISPLVSAQVGYLAEPEYSGPVAGGLIGLVLRPTRSLGIRLAGAWSRHGGESGPSSLLVALELGRP